MATLIFRTSRPEHLYTAIGALQEIASPEKNVILTPGSIALDEQYLTKVLPSLSIVQVPGFQKSQMRECKALINGNDFDTVLILDNNHGGFAYLRIYRFTEFLAPRARVVVHSPSEVRSYSSARKAASDCMKKDGMDLAADLAEFMVILPAYGVVRLAKAFNIGRRISGR